MGKKKWMSKELPFEGDADGCELARDTQKLNKKDLEALVLQPLLNHSSSKIVRDRGGV